MKRIFLFSILTLACSRGETQTLEDSGTPVAVGAEASDATPDEPEQEEPSVAATPPSPAPKAERAVELPPNAWVPPGSRLIFQFMRESAETGEEAQAVCGSSRLPTQLEAIAGASAGIKAIFFAEGTGREGFWMWFDNSKENLSSTFATFRLLPAFYGIRYPGEDGFVITKKSVVCVSALQ